MPGSPNRRAGLTAFVWGIFASSDVAALVEGVKRGPGGREGARDQARRPERADGGDAAAAVELAHGVCAVVQATRLRAGVALLPRPQAALLLAEGCDNVQDQLLVTYQGQCRYHA